MTKKQLEKLNKLKLLNKEILAKLSECFKIMKSINPDTADLWDSYGRQTQTSYVDDVKESSDEMSLSQAIDEIKNDDDDNTESGRHFSEM